MITCIILSAGLSSRFGSPKALAKIDDKPIITRLQNTLISSQVSETIIVLGANAKLIKPLILKHKRVRAVYNKDYNFGQTSSFQIGLKEVFSSTKGIMLLPVDYPMIKLETFNFLANSFLNSQQSIVVPTFNGIKGHPPIFNYSLRGDILQLDHQKGLNTIVKENISKTSFIPVEDKGVLQTFNTPQELHHLLQEID